MTYIRRSIAGIRIRKASSCRWVSKKHHSAGKNPDKLGSWLPILDQYGPVILIRCKNALNLSQELVSEWLAKYMFAGESDAKSKAYKIAAKLANHKNFKSHGRHIDREKAKKMGLIIYDLEEDQEFQDLVLSIFHGTTHSFTGTDAVKIIMERHLLNNKESICPTKRLFPNLRTIIKKTKYKLNKNDQFNSLSTSHSISI